MPLQGMLVQREASESEDEGRRPFADRGEFKLPFNVATIEEWEQRAYIDNNGRREWVFVRLRAFLKLASMPHRLLSDNISGFKKFLAELQCSDDQVHCRPLQSKPADAAWRITPWNPGHTSFSWYGF